MNDIKMILNPFIKHKGNSYNCFGCSPHNHAGLNLNFFSDGQKVFAHWMPKQQFEGYTNVVHGGIQATLMDEIASWYIYSMLDTAGVTKGMNVSYHKPLYVSSGEVKVEAELKKLDDRLAVILTQLYNAKGVLCSSATVEYFLFPPQLARSKYMYPGKEQFWE
ncbi:PaaI family thioesterase [Carboxylicivirga taeanensis]|uniref:PaaI family thioesterase n=1 Tax=Carboxylicivirga taeanensis TaxID=1416875 RepID=UPI003F6E123D